MHRPLVRQIVRQQAATISGGRSLHTWNDLLSSYPGIFGVKTGHTSAAGWNEGRGRPARPVTVYATLLGSPDRGERNADLAKLLDWGFARYRARERRHEGARLRARGRRLRPQAGCAGRGRVAEARRCGSTSRSSAGSSRWTRPTCPVSQGQSSRPGPRLPAWQARRRVVPLASPRARSRARASRPAQVGTRHVPCTTCGAGSRDRHGHHERGDRPHADRPELPARPAPPRERRADARRRQGDQHRAGAEAARRARRRHRPRRRPHRHAHRRGADRRGDPERLRPDRRRVAHLDRDRRPDRRAATPR